MMMNDDQMEAEIAEIEQELGYNVEQYFVPIPKPVVRLYGSAANGVGRSFAKIVEFYSSKTYYMAVVELTQVQFGHNYARCNVNGYGEVTIEGQITSAAIFADMPSAGNKGKRIQLCPREPWAISFCFPGPVDYVTTEITFPSRYTIEILVEKQNLMGENVASGPSSSATFVDHSPDLAGDTSPLTSEIRDMVDSWFE